MSYRVTLEQKWLGEPSGRSVTDSCLFVRFLGELQRQKEFEVAMFMYRTGEQQNAYNAMNSTKTHGTLICLLFCIKSSRNARPSQNLFIG